jgi:RNA polymerase sigma-70 factor (ECF subfamily)
MSDMALYKRSAEAAPAIPRTFDDEELMRLVCENDSTAFATLYERHARAAFVRALHMCGTHTLAEDVVQEAFLSLWRGAPLYDSSRGTVRTWVLGIVHHRALDILRRGVAYDRGSVGVEGIEEQLEATESTEREVARRYAARELRAILRRLPPEQSRVIELAYYGGFTNTEIAAMLGAPVGTIKGRMRLGLKKMRSQLHSEYVLW